MRGFGILAIALCIGLAGPGGAEIIGRMVPDAEAARWAAVGVLNVAGNRACTAVLISDHEALTAAACLFHRTTFHRGHPEDMKFVIGQRRDGYAALRGVKATAVLPGYVYTGERSEREMIAKDIALLALDAAVPADVVRPLTITDWPAGEAASLVDIVGYGQDRRYMAAIRENCPARRQSGTLTLVDCIAPPGLLGGSVTLSGEPDQPPRLVAVVAGTIGTRVNPVSTLAVDILPALEVLRAEIGTQD